MLSLIARPAIVDQAIALGPAEFAQTIHKRRLPLLRYRIALTAGLEHTNVPHRLTRPRREWPSSRRAAEQRDEVAPFHSITSLARASSMGGISRPSAFAVLRLTTVLNVVGACTGRSAGFSPLRIRSKKNALAFEVLSDVGQKVGRAFGLVYQFTDELRSAYHGFGRDIPAHNGAPGEWALPVSATYVIDRDGTIIYAYTDVDYRDRADPSDVLDFLTSKAAAA